MKTVATLIVKNEERVVQRCIDSLKSAAINEIIILDTGSRDSTVQIAKKNKQVHLYERPWINFATNRTEAIKLASSFGDYVLTIDADQTVVGLIDQTLVADAYNLEVRFAELRYRKPLLLSSKCPWYYSGAVHEALNCKERKEPYSFIDCDQIALIEHADSFRRQSKTRFHEDAILLEEQDKSDPRTIFYLARTYDDIANKEKALFNYKLRLQMQGYTEEIYYSMLRIGVLESNVTTLLKGWQVCPKRWECLYQACRLLRASEAYKASYSLSKEALNSSPAKSGLFLHADVYAYLLDFEHGISAYYVGDYESAILSNLKVLKAGRLPASIREQALKNLKFAQDRLKC